MAGMYSAGEYDLAGFSVGAVTKGDMLLKRLALVTSCLRYPPQEYTVTVIPSSGSVWSDLG